MIRFSKFKNMNLYLFKKVNFGKFPGGATAPPLATGLNILGPLTQIEPVMNGELENAVNCVLFVDSGPR